MLLFVQFHPTHPGETIPIFISILAPKANNSHTHHKQHNQIKKPKKALFILTK